MYGKKFMGIKRTTVLIGSNGTILKIWENVKVADHVAELVNTVKKLVDKNRLKIQ
jgi:peroxiredoxin Q/BCP